MTRSWTDPRTGKRWHIDVVRGTRADSRKSPRRGGGEEATSALVFESSGTSYALPTRDATQLEAMEDDRLAELLDAAKEGGPPGREAQPHRDPPSE